MITKKNIAASAATSYGGRSFCLFIRQLATLIGAGIELTSALETLSIQFEQNVLGSMLKEVTRKVSTGHSFSSALNTYPRTFDQSFIAMIKVAEQSGSLDTSLLKLADWKEREYNLIQKIKSALAYPIFVILITLAMLLGLFIFAIPQFMTMFGDLGVQAPASTRLLLAISDALRNPVLLLPATALSVAAVSLFQRQWKDPEAKITIFNFLHRLPIFGSLILLLGVSRFAAALEKLLEQGIPLAKVIGFAAASSGNPVITDASQAMSNRLADGEYLSQYIKERTDIFPASFAQYFSTGEESGHVDQMMRTANRLYEEDLTVKLEAMVTLIEPLALGFISCVVGFVIIAMASSTVALFQ